MKPRMKKIMMGIMVIGMANTVPAEASLLKWAGTVLENAVKRRIGNEVDSTVNATFDTAKESIKGEAGTVTPAGVTAGEHVTGKVTSTSKRGKALKYTGKYELIDLNGLKFKGEQIYEAELLINKQIVRINEFLDPGFYIIWGNSRSAQGNIALLSEHESEGVVFGYGIIPRKKIFNTGQYDMTWNKDNIMYIVEVLPNTQGHLEMSLVNSPNLLGAGSLVIWKVPGPTLVK